MLGFVEGDGTFSYNPEKNTFIFMIGQKGNINLICAIQNYLSNLAPVILPVKQGGLDSSLDLNNSQEDFTTPVLVQTKSGGSVEYNTVFIRRLSYIKTVIIPFFDSLS